ncbi:Aldehyde/histidinol dehydrogenase [Podospora appendiculata]|uniref:Aldehyde/histidinol dehydrogenase n=1 Tax=Podospora appendiculata TaxID=314037 RepID=A0AAE0X683_9PEZI|nr:Aldehyde/histidinol dehydrogenase [Podospora appendiculata]
MTTSTSSPEAAVAMERLEEAAVDGRTENIRYRQQQLQTLHQTLRAEASAICNALSQETRCPPAEAETEFYLGMDAVRHFYDGLDFDRALEDEYRVASAKDHPGRRVGVGMVIIRPTDHSRFYSIVTPLAAAISAGNCVVLELQETLSQMDSLLRSLLTKSMDINTFYISTTAIPDRSVLDAALLVDQTGGARPPTTAASPRQQQLVSSTTARVVAVVDRTADIEAAAQAITRARFIFGGTSPYAPDLVLVNEFVKARFFEACLRHATLAFASERDPTATRKVVGDQREATRRAVVEAEAKNQVTSFGSSEFKLVDILDKNTPLMTTKITGRYLPIATCSGLVDAAFTPQGSESLTPLLAGYFFADPRAAKYLAQHVACAASFVNQIPAQLLVGPAAPTAAATAHTPDYLHHRYTRDMFSLPRPQFVEPPPRAAEDLLRLNGGSGASGSPTGKVLTKHIRALAVRPLAPSGLPAKNRNTGIGFFDSGFFIGAGIALSVVLPALGWTSYVLARKGVEYAVRLRNR